jgi:hypothetical protein
VLHNHPHLSSGAGTIGQKWPQYKGLSPTPLAIKKTIQYRFFLVWLIDINLSRNFFDMDPKGSPPYSQKLINYLTPRKFNPISIFILHSSKAHFITLLTIPYPNHSIPLRFAN